MSDLGKRLAEGDDRAFTEVVEQYSRKVYALCYRILRDQEEARDMAQEVFVKVYAKRRSFGGRSQVYTWVYRIAVNLCLSALKRRKLETVPLDQVEPILAAGNADDGDCPVDLEALVASALRQLPPKQRSVFAMRFYDKLAFAEIAAAMGTSTGAAKANFHFAVERLRRLVGEVDTP
jgi:RNA polymerase sigma-70 factor (ECF subfamily)